jgi:hypothetical protein
MAPPRRLEFNPDPLGLIRVELTVPAPEEPTHTFRLLRPDDLVCLEVRCFRCRLDAAGEAGAAPNLRADTPGAWIEVGFSFQHLGEQAWYWVDEEAAAVTDPVVGPGEDPAAPPPNTAPGGSEKPPDPPPVLARAANRSRLCLDVPETELIEFTIAGFLAALSRLPLRVSEWATPRPQEARGSVGLLGLVNELPGGNALVLSDAGLGVVRRSRAAAARTIRAAAMTPQPGDPVRALMRGANELRTLRSLLSTQTAVDLAGIELAAPSADDRSAGAAAYGLAPWWGRLVPPRGGRAPRPPKADQTAIEAPYRLIISPSIFGGFTHANVPVASPGDTTRVELWHTRLGVRGEDPVSRQPIVDERSAEQRVVRAIWARDLDPRNDDDLYTSTDGVTQPPPPEPFRMSLDRRDRGMLVRQTADPTLATPRPIDVERLYLSTLGAWLDLHAAWSAREIGPYAQEELPSVLAWDHIAPLGRDQYVRVVYPGYMFPFGHASALVKITERKILEEVDPGSPQARLFQRKFLVIAEPLRTYTDLDMPFKQVRLIPLVTPDIYDPWSPTTPYTAQPLGLAGDHLFWPVVGGGKFQFTLDCLDQAGERVRLHAPLLFVAAHLGTAADKQKIESMYGDSPIPGAGQPVAIAKPEVPGDTMVEARSLSFKGEPGDPGAMSSRPYLEQAQVVVPAMRQLAPQATEIAIKYPQTYLDNGFTGANAGQVFAEVVGAGAEIVYESTQQSGGLVSPNLPVEGLSKTLGPIGDVATIAQGDFNPQQFLQGLGTMPKLFGIVDLVDLLGAAGLDEAPRFITEALTAPLGLIADLMRLKDSVTEAATRLQQAAQEPGADPALAPAAAKLAQIRAKVEPAASSVVNKVRALMDLETPLAAADRAALETQLSTIGTELGKLEGELAKAPFPPTVRAQLERLVAALKPLLAAAAEIEAMLDLIEETVKGVLTGNPAARARYEWKPLLKTWPEVSRTLPVDEQKEKAVIWVPEDGFTLSIEARASAEGDAGVDSLAELRDLSVNLLPGFELMSLGFDRVAFRGSSGRKPEVEVLFRGIEFKGILKFVQTLSEVIPLDGLSDPPYVEVSPSDARAGFDLSIPAIPVGVFSLENISFGLEARVPFVGEAVTVGFNFCTRERPFVLTVMMFGGGGFVGLQASPKGLVLVEGALEFGARVSLDFGVASGSIEAMGGVYYRHEDNKFTLTGYFRLRGEVELLGIASVSLTCELSLTYRDKGGGKDEMYGQAKVTLEVEVAFIEYSESFTVERHFAGSAGDPPMRDALDIPASGHSKAWADYCLAFAED